METTMSGSPLKLTGRLAPKLRSGLWLVKWLLVIPHLIVLCFLGIAFIGATLGAFFTILATGRYPKKLFSFNLGVLRWSWRVAFYGYGALGTDQYPPFTLKDVPEYPARLEVAFPESLSRRRVAVKWLLAVPHYLVVAVFAGGGLIGLLACFAGVALLYTGRYPRSIYDLLLGMNRWVFRVAVYVSLMTDEYPPFRLDMGGDEPTVTVPGQAAATPS
jgi:hypothetical protein